MHPDNEPIPTLALTLPQLPPLPTDPPSFVLPDPAADQHAYNRALDELSGYKWLVEQHTRQAQLVAMAEAFNSLGVAAANLCDSWERGQQPNAVSVAMMLLERWQFRPSDTESNIPPVIEKAVLPIVEMLKRVAPTTPIEG